MVWLAQEPDDELRALAEEAAARIGLPLTVVETGDGRLETRSRSCSATGRQRHRSGEAMLRPARATDYRAQRQTLRS